MILNLALNIPDNLISDTIACAFEGGSNYWITRQEVVDGDYKQAKWASEVPMAGGSLEIYEGNILEPHTLNRKVVERGLLAMSVRYPEQFATMITENGDVDTADVFLQCCLFGELIYG